MQNPLSQLFSSLLQPTVNEQVEKAISEKQPYAYGVGLSMDRPLKDLIGQPHDANFSLLYSLYKLNVDVAFGVHAWKGGVTSRGWYLDMEDEKAEPTPAEQEEIAAFTSWLRQPNPYKGFHLLLEGLVMHLAITGDAFWYVLRDRQGKPLEIWPMHPALTKIIATKGGEILGYVMKVPGEESVAFEPEEVLHFTTANPTSDIYGEGAVELVVEEAGIDLQALRSNKAIFANGMNPSAVILMDEGSKPAEATAVTEALKQSHTGSSNQHKLVAVSKVKDFKPWTMTHRDMEYLGLRNLSTTKVARGFRMPVYLFGEHNAGDFATAGLLLRETHQNVYIPLQNNIREVITKGLIHSFNPKYCFKLYQPDSSNPDELRRDYMQAKRDGIVEVDEARERGFGLNPLQREATEESEESTEETKSLAKSVTKAENSDIDPLAAERDELMESLGMALVDPITSYFTDQEAAYQSALTAELDDASLDTFLDTQKDAFDSALALLLASLLYPSLSAGVGAARTQVRSIAPADTQAAIDAALDTERANQIIQGYSKTQSFKQVTGINDTTRASLRAELAEGLRKQESVEQLSERIAKVFGTARDVRSDLIAQTEVSRAYAYANYEALAKLNAEGIVMFRQWITAEGGVCDICTPLNGITVPFEDQYPDGHEPGHVHPRCRCSEVGLIEEDNG